MKRQLVKKVLINKRTLLFCCLESGLFTLAVERSGMSWGSFLRWRRPKRLPGATCGEVNDVSRRGVRLR